MADRWAGVPVCAALTLWRKAMGRRATAKPPARIVFIKLAEQGATVLAYGALRKAVEMVGRANVFFLVFEENRFILDVMDVVAPQNVIAIPTHSVGSLVGGTWKAIRRLRAERVEAAIDLEFFARSSAVLTYLSGAGVRVGFHNGGGPWRGDLMTHRLSYNPYMHTMQTFEMMVDALRHREALLPACEMTPPPIDETLPAFVPTGEDIREVDQRLARCGAGGTRCPLILLNANASDLLPLRRWPSDRYVELARRLLATHSQAAIAFTGGPGEGAAAESLARAVGSERCFSLAGQTTLRQLMTLYARAEVLVTNDSGPAHFAALTPIDVVTLFGPETPALFGALTPRSHILWAGLACSPCVNAFNNRLSSCRDNCCMKALAIEAVEAQVARAVDRRRAAGVGRL
jgi:ADP-heptose:LPS heptosyltransferase